MRYMLEVLEIGRRMTQKVLEFSLELGGVVMVIIIGYYTKTTSLIHCNFPLGLGLGLERPHPRLHYIGPLATLRK